MKTYDERAHDILERRDAYNERKASQRNRLTVITALVLVTAILLAGIAAIASRRPDTPEIPGLNTTVTPVTNGDGTPVTNDDGSPKEYRDGVIGGRPEGYPGGPAPSLDAAEGYMDSEEKSYSGGVMRESEMPSPSSPEMMPTDGPEIYYNGIGAQAGTLTAGEWKDAAEIGFWKTCFQSQEWTGYAKARSLYAVNVASVRVTSSDGLPCFNCKVELLSGDKVLFTAKTDIEGRAYLFWNVNTDGETPDAVAAAGKTVPFEANKLIQIEAEQSENLKQLDMLLMIDTTGSMGDELEYIKAELADMVKRISEADEAYSIRVSVNFYRDEGDDYVVKFYDFRTDINDCLEQLKDEHANGGGDYPEAVHTALENAVTGHQWRNGAVKICFIVLDAPPHSESEIQGINEKLLKTVKEAASQGIRIIPVASSGVDTETEILLRSFAIMTGGTYIFLTNDSGIGGEHKEAEVGEHTVETLNECMIRVVCEYCGIYHGEKIPYTNPHPDSDPDAGQMK